MNTRAAHRVALALLFAMIGASAEEASDHEEDRPELEADIIAHPAGAAALAPRLATRGRRLYLTWLEEVADGGHALRVAGRRGETWGRPRTVRRGGILALAMDAPSLLVADDRELLAQWVGRGAGEYDVLVSRSSDDGNTWGKAFSPHRDGTPAEHGFPTLFGLPPRQPGGRPPTGIVWLDGRDLARSGATALRFTTIEDGEPGEEEILDPRVCDCCPTAAVLAGDTALVFYRDRSAEEVRDLAWVRGRPGAWSEPQRLSSDGWKIAGCPTNGPAAAADGDRIAVAWFTAAADQPRVLVAVSTDAGRSFAAPAVVAVGRTLGRVAVAWLPGGVLALTWVERSPEGRIDLWTRLRTSDGELEAPRNLTRLRQPARGWPSMARAGDAVFVVWSEAGGKLRLLELRLVP